MYDPDVLRQRLGALDYVCRAIREEYTGCADRRTIEIRELPGTGPAFSVLIRFDDPDGYGRFKAHCYLDRDWRIVNHSGKLDPKFIVDDKGDALGLGQLPVVGLA